jgi:hypothetical protein
MTLRRPNAAPAKNATVKKPAAKKAPGNDRL